MDLLSLKAEEIQAFNHLDKGDTFALDKAVAPPTGGLRRVVLPGGVANPSAADRPGCRRIRQGVLRGGKPVGAICHAPWTLIEADVVRGRTMTSWPACRPTCATPAPSGSTRRCDVDSGLVTSPNPDDLPAFNAKIVEEFGEGEHEEQREKAVS